MLDTLLHHPSITLTLLLYVCQLHVNEGSLIFFPLWWTVLKGLHYGNVAEISIFIGGNRAKYLLMHAVQRWSHSAMARNLLHCCETPQWQHDGLGKIWMDFVKIHKRHPL